MNFRAIVLYVILGLLFSCDNGETEEIVIDYGYEYYPLEIGNSWTYQVDSIIFDPAIGGTALDSTRSYIREVITDTLESADGETAFIIEHYYRHHDTLAWEIASVYTLVADEQRAYRTEDNLRFIKLVFPLKKGSNWDGNAFFDDTRDILIAGESVEMFKNWSYEVLESGISRQIGDLLFEEVAVVQNADDENLIERRYAVEEYARGVGLISKELLIADTQCSVCCNGDFSICEPLPWREKAEKGMIVKWQLIDY